MKKATMKDIAERAGLTRQAVSVILNRKTPESGSTRPHGDATRQKVLAIARELNYQPNYFAQSLKRGKTSCIGIIGSGGKTLGFHSSHFTRQASAVEYMLEELKSPYSLITFGANYHETSYARTIELVGKGMVDGLLILLLARDIPSFEENLLPVLNDNNIPFVVVHTLSRELHYNNVGRDTVYGGCIMARHLAGKGYGSFGYLCPESFNNAPDWAENYHGFLQGLADTGHNPDDVQMLRMHKVHSANSHRVYETVMAADRIPQCISTIITEQAYAVERALKERGLRIPEDVALLGGEDDKAPDYIEKHITTITNPLEEMGRAAVTMLLELLDGTRDRDVVQRKIIKPELIIRKTT